MKTGIHPRTHMDSTVDRLLRIERTRRSFRRTQQAIAGILLVGLIGATIYLATALPMSSFSIVALAILFLVFAAVVAGLVADRRRRLAEILTYVEQLRNERERLAIVVSRVGEAAAANLDRTALIQLVLSTATETLSADHGSATVGAETLEWHLNKDAPRTAFAAGEEARRQACAKRELRCVEIAGQFAMAHPITIKKDQFSDVLVVTRKNEPFSTAEQRLFVYLAKQIGVAIENVELHERMRHEAKVDELTGLVNHRQFQEQLSREVARAHRYKRQLSLLMIDIDHFKRVNDMFGHQQGDAVLRVVADALHSMSRETDTPARYGGEELTVILPDTNAEGAYQAAESIREAVNSLSLVNSDGSRITLTVSIGVAELAKDITTPADLIAVADAAMYHAKRSGRNQTTVGITTEQSRSSLVEHLVHPKIAA